jgi:hypothetical protein
MNCLVKVETNDDQSHNYKSHIYKSNKIFYHYSISLSIHMTPTTPTGRSYQYNEQKLDAPGATVHRANQNRGNMALFRSQLALVVEKILFENWWFYYSFRTVIEREIVGLGICQFIRKATSQVLPRGQPRRLSYIKK